MPRLATPEAAEALLRIARALERLVPGSPPAVDFDVADAFVRYTERGALLPVTKVNRVDMALLRGIDRVRDILSDNTERFARGFSANNALLWGARGMGKSSLVKAVHVEINQCLSEVRPFYCSALRAVLPAGTLRRHSPGEFMPLKRQAGMGYEISGFRRDTP